MAHLTLPAPGQFPICPRRILTEIALTWSLAISYQALPNLPYPVPPAILETILGTARTAIREIARRAIR